MVGGDTPLTLALSPAGRGDDAAPLETNAGLDDEARATSALRGEVDAKHRVRGLKLTKFQVAKGRVLRTSMTDAEVRLWRHLRNRGLEDRKFVRQLPIGHYVADFACREAMLVIEVDGGQHSASARDEKRTAFLNSEGYAVLRFWNNEVLSNTSGVIETILLVMEGHPPPGLRYAAATCSRAAGEGKKERSHARAR